MTEVLLPHKLSELAQLALDDVVACQSDPAFCIMMGTWRLKLDESCAVCAAGAIASNRLGLDCDINNEETFVEMFGEHNARALWAVDLLRRGSVGLAQRLLNAVIGEWIDASIAWDQREPDGHPLTRNLASFASADGGAAWKADMAKLIANLQKAGL